MILGNPPYDGFADVAVEAEERALSNEYRSTKRVRSPEGQGLNNPYVRFFRMAERRIAEKTGKGVISFISDYSWLDGPSFTGMREHCLEAFDTIRIDCLNGDSRATGKVAPDGSPDPSIFSTDGDPVGIQVGTAIATLIRKADHKPSEEIGFRHLWGQSKPEELSATAEAEPDALYDGITPDLRLGLPFARTTVSDEWFDWPALPDLFPKSFPGVQTKRDSFLIDIDLDRLRERIADYFDPALSHDEIERRYPAAMKSSSGFVVQDARAVRTSLLARGGPLDSGFVRHAYRPFDQRWLYWEPGHGLLGRPVPAYRPHVFKGNLWLSEVPRLRRHAVEPQAVVTSGLAALHVIEWSASMFPVWLRADALREDPAVERRPNVSGTAQRYLHRLGASVEDLFYHVLVTVHDPAYRAANAGALRLEWPRIPLPGWEQGRSEGAAAALARSAARGRELAGLLDPDRPVPGVTAGTPRPALATIAVPATAHGRNMAGEDFAVTAGWGHFGSSDAVMPGQGRAVERVYTPSEHAALSDAAAILGPKTFDIYLNKDALWSNVPAAVWAYKLGGYQVLKKWLSYRERGVLNRSLTPREVLDFMQIARRIAAILTTTPRSTRPTEARNTTGVGGR